MSAETTADWLAVVVSQGGASPLLIVADNRSIAEQALAWDRSLSEAGWEYRVRLGEVAGQQAACEAGLMAREAAGFGACSILAVGSPEVVAVAAAAARIAGLPMVHAPRI